MDPFPSPTGYRRVSLLLSLRMHIGFVLIVGSRQSLFLSRSRRCRENVCERQFFEVLKSRAQDGQLEVIDRDDLLRPLSPVTSPLTTVVSRLRATILGVPSYPWYASPTPSQPRLLLRSYAESMRHPSCEDIPHSPHSHQCCRHTGPLRLLLYSKILFCRTHLIFQEPPADRRNSEWRRV